MSLDHLTLGDKGAFGFRGAVDLVPVAQGELRAGHQAGAAELGVELLGGCIQRAPAFGGGAAPQGGLGVERGEVPEGDADLAHGAELAAHDVAEDGLKGGVDHGV